MTSSLQNNPGIKRPLEDADTCDRINKRSKITHHLTLKKIYIQQIREGKKTVEGRIADNRIKKISPNDELRFYYYSNSKDDVRCRVLEVTKFDSFREMLNHYGVEHCLPGIKTLNEGSHLYDVIPGYLEKAQKNGVVGIKLSLTSEKV